MLPGPAKWCSSQDAFCLKELYGQAKSFQSLQFMAQAAKMRVMHSLDCHMKKKATMEYLLFRICTIDYGTCMVILGTFRGWSSGKMV